jgi:hypothetical protein
MRVDIEIGHRTKTLNQRDRPDLGITLFESDLFDQKMSSCRFSEVIYGI